MAESITSTSPEHDFGYWRVSRADGRRARLSWRPGTGELYAAFPNGIRLAFGYFGADDIEALRRVWAERCLTHSLAWVADWAGLVDALREV